MTEESYLKGAEIQSKLARVESVINALLNKHIKIDDQWVLDTLNEYRQHLLKQFEEL